jgi:hypothetical protein
MTLEQVIADAREETRGQSSNSSYDLYFDSENEN